MKSATLWPVLFGALLSSMATGAAAWMVFGQDKVTRSEMVDYVSNHTPWAIDRGQILMAIEMNRNNGEKIGESVDRLIVAQQQLIVEQRVLVTKVNQLLNKED